MGFCNERARLDRLLGWDKGSWAYHKDDGKLYVDGNTRGIVYGESFALGDWIGCGIDNEKKTAFFTKNGVSLGT